MTHCIEDEILKKRKLRVGLRVDFYDFVYRKVHIKMIGTVVVVIVLLVRCKSTSEEFKLRISRSQELKNRKIKF